MNKRVGCHAANLQQVLPVLAADPPADDITDNIAGAMQETTPFSEQVIALPAQVSCQRSRTCQSAL